MNNYSKALAAVMLSTAMVAGHTQTTASSTTPHKKKTTRKAVAKKPSVESQIEQLRRDMDAKIQSLSDQLAAKDQQLQAARDQATAAQATAQQAQQAAQAQQQAVSDTNQQVTTLSSAVTDLKSTSTSMAQTIQDEQVKTKAAIENPNVLHYKGVGITPGGYMAAETVYRSKATGADIPTAFNALPFPSADLAHLSEFYGSGRQSRVSFLAEGKLGSATLRGYVEADFLGTGTSSNNNQSNSYVLRQRTVWAQAELNSGFTFAGGQMWSLATETKKGLSNYSGDIASPQTIDPNYLPGFVWTRQYGVRVVKNFGQKAALGLSLENPQSLAPAVTGDQTGITYFWGTPGANGGNYNAGANTGTTTPNCTTTTVAGVTTTTCKPIVPSYLATYSINATPDFILKLAVDPGWGHYEVFGIGRTFRDRVYLSATSSAGAYNDTEVGGGLGGSLRVPLFRKKLDAGVKGLYGTGVGRYGASQIADVTLRPSGMFSPLRGFSALSTLELHATPRLDIYANYGGDYVKRVIYTNATTGKALGYGFNESNATCQTEQVPSGANGGGPGVPLGPTGCSGNTRDVQSFVLGEWYDFYKGPKGRLRFGLQYDYAARMIWADKAGFAPKGIENMFWTSLRYYVP